VLGWPSGTYIGSYLASREETTDAALEASPLWPHLTELADGQERTSTELLKDLELLAGEQRPRNWPKTARVLSGMLTRLAPDLRRVGIELSRGTIGSKSSRRNTITLRKNSESCDPCDPCDPLALQSQIRGAQEVDDNGRGAQGPSAGVAGGRRGSQGRPSESPVFMDQGLQGSQGSQLPDKPEDNTAASPEPSR
jgi:hypothetical protein